MTVFVLSGDVCLWQVLKTEQADAPVLLMAKVSVQQSANVLNSSVGLIKWEKADFISLLDVKHKLWKEYKHTSLGLRYIIPY